MNSEFRIPFVNLVSKFQPPEVYLNALSETLRSGNFVLSSAVIEFENKIAEYIGVKHCIAVANGSDALFLLMKTMSIGPGDEVITCPNSFIASAWSIVATGAKPVFCDVDESLCMDPQQLERLLTRNTKAIMPVHLAGTPANMQEIMEIANAYNLNVIEDAAQAIGASINGKSVGSLGTAGAFSLHPLKNLAVVGDGGFITTNDSSIAQRVKLLRNHGLKNRNECEIWGYNSRLDELQARIGIIGLARIDSENQRRREIAQYYSDEFINFLQIPSKNRNSTQVFHRYIVHLSERDSFMQYLKDFSIETSIHYPIPIHLQECSKDLKHKIGDFPISEYQSTNSLSLPLYPELLDSEVEYIVETVKSYFKKAL